MVVNLPVQPNGPKQLPEQPNDPPTLTDSANSAAYSQRLLTSHRVDPVFAIHPSTHLYHASKSWSPRFGYER
jgi:hypothetical protein